MVLYASSPNPCGRRQSRKMISLCATNNTCKGHISNWLQKQIHVLSLVYLIMWESCTQLKTVHSYIQHIVVCFTMLPYPCRYYMACFEPMCSWKHEVWTSINSYNLTFLLVCYRVYSNFVTFQQLCNKTLYSRNSPATRSQPFSKWEQYTTPWCGHPFPNWSF